MKLINVATTDPALNLALEQYVFDQLDRGEEYCMLWQNDNAIIIGKHQNTDLEIHRDVVDAYGISVVRRLSGGGAVYHDLGNLNFTFIVNQGTEGAASLKSFDFRRFCIPVIRALEKMGVEAELNGRNDMTIGGLKFSGNSQYVKEGRVMHHGTLMFRSDLTMVEKALRVSHDKLRSKGVKSVASRVTNIADHMEREVSVDEFRKLLIHYLSEEWNGVDGTSQFQEYHLTSEDMEAAERLAQERYRSWEWNYGSSPPYEIRKSRRFEGCGEVCISMNIHHGCIEELDISGDYFGNGEKETLLQLLRKQQLNRNSLENALKDVELKEYIANLSKKELIDFLLEM